MATPAQNPVSRLWFLSLFGALAFNLSATPSLAVGGTRDLASTATGSDACQNQIDGNESADCQLEMELANGKKVVTHAKVSTVTSQPRRYRDETTGKLISVPGGDQELEVQFDDLTVEGCKACGQIPSSPEKTFRVKMSDFRSLSDKIDDQFEKRAALLAPPATVRERVAQVETKSRVTRTAAPEACAEEGADTSPEGADALLICQINQVGQLKGEAGANYFAQNIQPVLMRQLISPDIQVRRRAQERLEDLDLISDVSARLKRSVATLEKYKDFADDGYKQIERANRATNPADKQFWVNALAEHKSSWQAELSHESPIYMTQLNLIGTNALAHGAAPGAAPGVASSGGGTTGSGRTARGNVNEKPGVVQAPARPNNMKASANGAVSHVIIVGGPVNPAPAAPAPTAVPAVAPTAAPGAYGPPRLGQAVSTLSPAPSR